MAESSEESRPRGSTSRRGGEPPFLPNSRGILSRIAARRAAQAGADVTRLKREAGLPANLETETDQWVGASNQITFLNLVSAALSDDLFGFHLALDFDLRELGPFFYIMASADTLGDALAREERYTVLVSEGLRVKCRRAETLLVETEYVGVERHLDRHQVEFWMTCTLRKARELTGSHIVPIVVSWIHQRGQEAGEIAKYFETTPRFGADHDRLSFSRNTEDLRLTTSDPHLSAFLVGYAEEVISQRPAPSTSLRTRVENAITPRLAHRTATQAAVAAVLGFSSRSLARKLAEQGLTYRQILDELRAQLGLQYIRNPNLTISQIAWMLGYADLSGFERAFKGWTGKSPRDFRATQTQDEQAPAFMRRKPD